MHIPVNILTVGTFLVDESPRSDVFSKSTDSLTLLGENFSISMSLECGVATIVVVPSRAAVWAIGRLCSNVSGPSSSPGSICV